MFHIDITYLFFWHTVAMEINSSLAQIYILFVFMGNLWETPDQWVTGTFHEWISFCNLHTQFLSWQDNSFIVTNTYQNHSLCKGGFQLTCCSIMLKNNQVSQRESRGEKKKGLQLIFKVILNFCSWWFIKGPVPVGSKSHDLQTVLIIVLISSACFFFFFSFFNACKQFFIFLVVASRFYLCLFCFFTITPAFSWSGF